jgi:putative membrane protein
MDRRVVLTGLAAAAAAPALAQTGGSRSAGQPGAPGGTAAGAGSPAAEASRTGGQQMARADMQHMQQTMQLGLVALEASRMAQQKAQNADLKRFATFEVQEQTTLSEVLRSMTEPAATATTASSPQPGQTSAAPADAQPMQLDDRSREQIQRLQNARAGEAFDREYLQGQMEGHSALLQVQTQYLQSNPQNREQTNVAKLARTAIVEHVALLEDIQSRMK